MIKNFTQVGDLNFQVIDEALCGCLLAFEKKITHGNRVVT